MRAAKKFFVFRGPFFKGISLYPGEENLKKEKLE